jgi:hypothetical protein
VKNQNSLPFARRLQSVFVDIPEVPKSFILRVSSVCSQFFCQQVAHQSKTTEFQVKHVLEMESIVAAFMLTTHLIKRTDSKRVVPYNIHLISVDLIWSGQFGPMLVTRVISIALYLTHSKLDNAQNVNMFFMNFIGVNTPTLLKKLIIVL